MRSSTHEGYILRVRPVNDQLRIVNFFSDTQGMLSLKVFGGKSARRRGRIENLAKGEAVITQNVKSELGVLKSFDAHNPLGFQNLDPLVFGRKSYVAEWVEIVAQNSSESTGLYTLLDWALKTIEGTHQDISVMRIFELCLAHGQGILPGVDLKQCAVAEEASYRFNCANGSCVCVKDRCASLSLERNEYEISYQGLLLLTELRQSTAPHLYSSYHDELDRNDLRVLGRFFNHARLAQDWPLPRAASFLKKMSKTL